MTGKERAGLNPHLARQRSTLVFNDNASDDTKASSMNAPLEPEQHRALRRRLERLTAEHRSLDKEIRAMTGVPYPNQLELRRLKKQKLQLREEIEQVKSALIPDLNA